MESFSYESAELPKKSLVAGLIIKDGRLLLVHNIKHGLRIEPPGGKIQDGETPEQAVVREIMEELGVSSRPTSLLGMYTTDSPEGAFEVHMFLCDIIAGEPQHDREPEKIGHFDWFSLDELKALSAKAQKDASHILVPNLQQALEDIALHMRIDGPMQ
jgi:8-oxo-dGTP diphosphatase